MPHLSHELRLLAFALGCFSISGCGSGGVPTFEASGTVTFDGKPVLAGRVDFIPDVANGNDGPQGHAIIKDGAFDTRKGGQGHAGGAMLIRIEGFDGISDNPRFPGTPIFPVHEIKQDLPKSSGTLDFDVPASAAKDFVPPPKSKS